MVYVNYLLLRVIIKQKYLKFSKWTLLLGHWLKMTGKLVDTNYFMTTHHSTFAILCILNCHSVDIILCENLFLIFYIQIYWAKSAFSIIKKTTNILWTPTAQNYQIRIVYKPYECGKPVCHFRYWVHLISPKSS